MKSKHLIKHLLVFTTFLLLCISAPAPGATTKAYQLSPSLIEQWTRLLHYRAGSSAINDSDFFLSPQGNHSPDAEFASTIAAFSKKGTAAHCKYPARYLWIKEKLGNNFGLSIESCEKFSQWKKDNPAESISLIYVTGYLENPASFFGHLLMKFNKGENDNADIELLDAGINFGADASPEDNPVKYIVYGMFGGYSARYTSAHYYLHTASYAENEQRELWEYELNLSAEEVALLQAHLWELQEVKFSYYFLSENCSTAMAHIISIVLERPILSGYQPWDMPVDIFHALPTIEHNGSSLVKTVKQRQSKYTRIQRKYLALNDEEKQWALSVARNIEALNAFMNSELTAYSKAKVLDVLTEYIELLIVTNKESSDEYREKKRQLLVSRLEIDSFSIGWPTIKSEPPHKAQLPINLGLGTGYSDKYGTYTSLRGYAAYYDFLSIDTARYKDSSITVLDSEIHVTENKVWLKNVDLINIASLNTNDVELFENNQFAWQMQLSVKQDKCASSACYLTYMRGFLGIADKWSDNLTLYTMLGPQIGLTHIGNSNIQLPSGFLYSWSNRWKTHFAVTPEFNVHKENVDINLDLTTRFSISNKTDIRIKLEKKEGCSLGLYFNYYL